jgi:3-phenylpropionate/cinnamic acid dioxygenase small subunit
MTVTGDLGVQTRLSVEAFLFTEARLLDERRFEEWVDLFAEDGRYEVPVRVTREAGAEWELAPTARIFDDTKQTLQIRVSRLRTDFAWAEQPPSRTRHFVSNVAVEPTDVPAELVAVSNLLVYRSRGDWTVADLLSAQRRDRIRRTDEGWRFVHRWTALDQSNVSAHNLSIFI